MAGGNPPKPPSNKPSNPAPPSSQRNKSRWESSSSASAATTTPDKKPSSSEPNKSKSTLNNNPKPPTPKPKPNHYSSKPSPKPINPSPRPDLIPSQSKLPPFPFPDPPPRPAYGFHSLDRRAIVLADGSVRSYFALPLDYQDFTPLPPRPEIRGPGFGLDRKFPISPEFRGHELRHEMGERGDGLMRGRSQEYRNAVGFRPGMGEVVGTSLKRKFGDEGREGRDGFERQRQQLLQYGNVDGNSNRMPGTSGVHVGRGGEEVRVAKLIRTDEGNVGGQKHHEVDQALKKAFLHFVKLIFENANQRKKYLANGKQGSLQCLACGRFAIRMTLIFFILQDFVVCCFYYLFMIDCQ